jgi:hypothetical protein
MFICPLHFFIIGDGNGYGIQGFFYRYQISSYGISFIPITNEIGYVTSGLIDGKSAISILLWSFSTFIFSLVFFFFLLMFHELKKKNYTQISGLLVISSIFMILSSFSQYGFYFYGPAGVSILIGIPILIGIAWIIRNEGDIYESSNGSLS